MSGVIRAKVPTEVKAGLSRVGSVETEGVTVMPIATPEIYAQMLDTAKQRGFAYPAINVTTPTGCGSA